MKNFFFVAIGLFSSTLLFCQEKDSLNTFVNILDTVVLSKVTYYPLDNIGQSSIYTDADVRRIVMDKKAVVYDFYLSQSIYDVRIGYSSLQKLKVAIIDLKKDLEQIDRTQNYYTNNFYYLDNGFKIGYYFKKDQPQWYFKLSVRSRKSELATIMWFEEVVQEGLDKLNELMEIDRVLD